MTRDPDDLIRALDLLWLRAELAALPEATADDSPVAGLRNAARRALLRAQKGGEAGGEDAPSGKDLDRLILLLMLDRLWRSGGRMIREMDNTRFQLALDAQTDQPAPFSLRLDVTRPGFEPGVARDGDEGPAA